MSDERLGVLAGRGDQAAFVELTRRYRRLIRATTRGSRTDGVEEDDLTQAALLALWEACQAPGGARCFASLAATLVRWRVSSARKAANAQRHRALNDALRDSGENGTELVDGTAGPEANDPARVVELRERLAERAQITRPREIHPIRGGRTFTEEQVTRALAMIAGGALRSEAAAAVGVRPYDVQRWLDAPVKTDGTDQMPGKGADVVSLAGHSARKAGAPHRLTDDAGLKGAA